MRPRSSCRSPSLPPDPRRPGFGCPELLGATNSRPSPPPYPPEADGRSETLIAMPALNLDASFVHLNLGDKHGNAAYNGVDPYFDDLYCMAAEKRYVSVERIVETEELVKSVPLQNLLLNRMMVDAVVEAPNGAHFTLAGESYGRDEKFQRHYAESAKTPRVVAGVRRHLPLRQRRGLPSRSKEVCRFIKGRGSRQNERIHRHPRRVRCSRLR